MAEAVVADRSLSAAIGATVPVGLHVGYHKCASTTLQKNLFANHPQLQPLRKTAGFEDADRAIEIVTDKLSDGADLAGEGIPSAAMLLWQRAERKARAAGRLPVFSWENLTRDFYFKTPYDDRLPKALKALVGEARIFIVIRHQIRLLESLYLSRIKPPSYLTPEKWFEAEGRRTATAYCYADVISAYQSVFGVENVLVLPFEEIAANPERFAHKLCQHMGVDPRPAVKLLTQPAKNSRPSATVHLYSRFRRNVLPGVSFSRVLPAAWRSQAYRLLSKGKSSEVVFAPDLVAALENVYRPQNRRLMESLGLDLQRFGYPL